MDVRKLKDEAVEAVARGKLGLALDLYSQLVKTNPGDIQLLVRLGDVQRRQGNIPEAIVTYGKAADGFEDQGLILRAIAVCKLILELDATHEPTQQRLAELHARRLGHMAAAAPAPAAGSGARSGGGAGSAPAAESLMRSGSAPAAGSGVGRAAPGPAPVAGATPPARAAPGHSPTGLKAGSESRGTPATVGPAGGSSPEQGTAAATPTGGAAAPSETLDDILLVVDVDTAGLDAPTPPSWAQRLPAIPLFSDIAPDAFVRLLETCRIRRLVAGDVAVHQGERGVSFFVVVHGALEVMRREDEGGEVRLAVLRDGSFFGEMSLLNGSPRSASVRAVEDSDLLEFTATTLRRLVAEHPTVGGALRRFYRQRLLTNVMATSPLFRPLDRDARLKLIERFRSREVGEGEVLIAEGERAGSLFVLLSGRVEVSKRVGEAATILGELREGELFGEYSLLSGKAASATCRMAGRGMVLRLPADEFRELSTAHPAIREIIEGVSGERQRSNEQKVSTPLPSDEDDLILL